MKTLRHNIYNKVHRNLRTLMLDAGLKIQKTDFSRQKETEATLQLIREVIKAFEYHVQNEDDKIYHAIADKAPYIVAMFEKTSFKNLQIAINIMDMADQFETIRNKNEKVKHGSYLQNVFFEFTAAVLQAMNKEETVVNELLWSYYNDKEIVALENKVVVPEAVEESVIQEERINKGTEFIKWMDGIIETARIIITPQVFGKNQAA